MLVLVGMNHRSAPLTVRERIAFGESELADALARLTGDGMFDEGMILSTCNRVEILARSGDGKSGPDVVKDFLAKERGVSRDEINRYSYHRINTDAVRHLFQVASGLDSMVLGEPQILGQVKRAYAAARAARTTGSILERLLQQGLAVAKRVRTETGISRHAVSIAFAAVELARRIFDDLHGKSALLLGAGKMGELAARHLVANGVTDIVVSSRTFNRAAILAERINGAVVNWDEAFDRIEKVDIVVSGTGAPGTVLDKTRVQRALRGRRGRPLFLIDIAVPRDVEPDVNDIDGVYLYDIDSLQGVVDHNLEERGRAAEEARALIEREVEEFDRWKSTLEVKPTIIALRETLLEMAKQEVGRFRRRLGPLSPEQQRVVEEMARALVQKILHRPITHLKRSLDQGEAGHWASLYRDIFGIPQRTASESVPEKDEPEGPAQGPQRLLRGGKED